MLDKGIVLLILMFVRVADFENVKKADICQTNSQEVYTCDCSLYYAYCDIYSQLKTNDWKNFVTNEVINELEMSAEYNGDETINSFPVGIFKNFPSLEIFSLSSGNIPVLKTDSFQGSQSLKKVTLDDNNIKKLKIKAVSGMKSLEELNLQNNVITILQREIFSDLPKILTLNLMNNKIQEIEDGVFDGMSTLTNIKLNKNELTKMKKGTFRSLKNLKELHLQENQIVSLESGCFDGMRSLYGLDLSLNVIETLKPNTFKDLSDLGELFMSHNGLVTLGREAFRGMDNVALIDLSNNKLTNFKRSWFKYHKFNGTGIEVIIYDNPLICSCDLYWMLTITNNHFFEQALDEANCKVTKDQPFNSLNVDQMYRLIEIKDEMKPCEKQMQNDQIDGEISNQSKTTNKPTDNYVKSKGDGYNVANIFQINYLLLFGSVSLRVLKFI